MSSSDRVCIDVRIEGLALPGRSTQYDLRGHSGCVAKSVEP